MISNRVKEASKELMQNQIILMLICVGIITLLFLLYGIFSNTSDAPFIESALGLNALLAFLLGYILPQKIGGVNRLYRLGFLRMDIFNTYVRVAGYYTLNTVTLILFIGIFVNILPWLNSLNSVMALDVLMIIISTTLYTFGLYLLGIGIRIAINGPRLYALLGVILLIITIQPLLGSVSGAIGIVVPLIMTSAAVYMLYALLRAIKIERQL